MRLLGLPAVALTAVVALASSTGLPVSIKTQGDSNSRLINVHVELSEAIQDPISFTYGSCGSLSQDDAEIFITRSQCETENRLVWVIPEETSSGGCISAWSSSGTLVGRSVRQKLEISKQRGLQKRSTETAVSMTSANGIDALGAWFDGVELLSQKEFGAINVTQAKSKGVAIVGAGMSGLMSYLVLSQAGLTNISIIEAGSRLGGRVHTSYLSGGSFNYSYQEMGPMRIPATYTSPVDNKTYDITDQKLLFDLVEELNSLHNHDANWTITFSDWINDDENSFYYKNGFKLPSGLPPTIKQVKQNPSLGANAMLDGDAASLEEQVNHLLPGTDFMVSMAKNMFKAHKEWLDSGLDGMKGDEWSEFAFMVQYLNGSLNSTDMLGATDTSFWTALYEDLYFSAGATWKTIDGGLNRLPESFHPLVDHVTTLNRTIERIKSESINDEKKITLQWRNDYTDLTLQNSTYDFALISAPFSVVRRWRLPELPATMKNAINKLPYGSACKVALEFSERFWEHYENPIFGGCSTITDLPGLGSICYPSYNMNGTGPASILASYVSNNMKAASVMSISEDEHVQQVLDAMVEIHGDFTRQLYTGNYNRRCWGLDPLEAGSWADPTVGQHQLYMPEYFKTHEQMIFIGEHTSYTHAWIASALESGIRGSVQLLLELGLVDEAKAAVEKWMARWIDL